MWIFCAYQKPIAGKVGTAFLKGGIAAFFVIGLVEASVHIGKAVMGTCFWDSMKAEDLIKQIPILLCCIILFVVMNMLRYKLDVKHFEAQDF